MSDARDAFGAPGAEAVYVLRLYVSGNTHRSTRAIHNLRSICEQYLSERYTLEVVDIYHNPLAAKQAQIIAVPTLVKLEPGPRRLLIGDLSDSAKLRAALDIEEDERA